MRVVSDSFSFRRLGLWYGIYRLIIASSLLAIFFLNLSQSTDEYKYQTFYIITLIIYTFISLLQFLLLYLSQSLLPKKIIFFSIIDVSCFSLLTFAQGAPNLHISLLFAITIFITNLLLSHRKALSLTLLSIISVVYIPFIDSWLYTHHLNNIGSTLFLAFLFLVIYFTAQFTVKRFENLTKVNNSQSIAILQLQDLNQYILEQVDMGYLVINDKQHVILVNPAAHELLNIEAVQPIKDTPLQSIQPELYEYIIFNRLSQGERFIFEPQGLTKQIHIRIQKLKVPQQLLTLFIMQDAQKFNDHVQQLKLAALGQLSASIAHEIRNPLASIVQANELLADADDSERAMLQNMISKQSLRINHTIESTLDMARSQTPITKTILLNHFLIECLKDDFSDVPKDQIQLSILLQIYIKFDETHLRQILINLIRNGLRHTSKEQATVEVKAYTKNQYAVIDIIDFGSGIPEHHIRNLFSPFFTTEINGTGLGLYLSRSLCDANQATLNYIKLKHATCFRIECPLVVV